MLRILEQELGCDWAGVNQGPKSHTPDGQAFMFKKMMMVFGMCRKYIAVHIGFLVRLVFFPMQKNFSILV